MSKTEKAAAETTATEGAPKKETTKAKAKAKKKKKKGDGTGTGS